MYFYEGGYFQFLQLRYVHAKNQSEMICMTPWEVPRQADFHMARASSHSLAWLASMLQASNENIRACGRKSYANHLRTFIP